MASMAHRLKQILRPASVTLKNSDQTPQASGNLGGTHDLGARAPDPLQLVHRVCAHEQPDRRGHLVWPQPHVTVDSS